MLPIEDILIHRWYNSNIWKEYASCNKFMCNKMKKNITLSSKAFIFTVCFS